MESTKKSILTKLNISTALKELLGEFWFAPMDAYLRAFEVAIWKNIKFVGPVLDIGCGDGRIDSFLFAGKSIDVGLDPSKEAIALAKNNYIYKNVVISRAEKLPFKDNSFNTVILNSTFEHIKRDLKAVEEISRVLRKGGRLIFTTTTDIFMSKLKDMFSDSEQLKRFNNRVAHFHYRTYEEWKNILSKNSLNIVDRFTYFTDNDLRNWLLLFKIFTFKIRGRELWSYLKDSRISKYLPSRFISLIEFNILFRRLDKNISGKNMWQFISARKEL